MAFAKLAALIWQIGVKTKKSEIVDWGTEVQDQLAALAVGKGSVVSKDAAYTAKIADNLNLYVSSAAFTLSLDPAATLGNGWSVWVCAIVGAITIDPDGAELVGNAATLVIPQGKSAKITCDGVGFPVASFIRDISQADFDAGASTVEGTISAEKLKNTIAANSSGLTYQVSSEIAFGNPTTTWSHSHGTPKIYGANLICKTANLGYSVNTLLMLSKAEGDGARPLTMMAKVDEINIYNGSFFANTKGSTGDTTLNKAYWKVIFWGMF